MTLRVETRHAVSPAEAKALDTAGLRAAFHVGGLFAPGEVRLVYTHYDRLILGGAVPSGGTLVLDHVAETGTAGFLDRRELAVVLIAGSGTVRAGRDWAMAAGDILYLPMGTGPVEFSGEGRFYLLSAPAHRACAARLVTPDQAVRIEAGSEEQANRRQIAQYLVPEVAETCQLVCGITRFAKGSVWNTMPAHLHDRRMEAYLYFDMAPGTRVFHMMGQPQETRHLVVANEEAVISPPWSIHCGCGTGGYAFVWAMAGDNMTFSDMDPVAMEALR